MPQIIQTTITIIAILFLATSTQAGEINASFFGNNAIDGYDTVNYSMQAKATEGEKNYSVKWKGANWKFISQKHKDLFAQNPEKYAPQYGGHCANAMSINKKVSANSKIWLIHNDKLFLFYAKGGKNRWQSPQENIQKLIEQADNNWATLKDK